MWRADSFEKTRMLRKIEGRRRKGRHGQDSWMASLTQWTWVWASSGRCLRTGKPGVLQSLGSKRVRHDRATEQQQPPCLRRYLSHLLSGHLLSLLYKTTFIRLPFSFKIKINGVSPGIGIASNFFFFSFWISLSQFLIFQWFTFFIMENYLQGIKRVWIGVIASSLISLMTLLSQGYHSYKDITHCKTLWDFLLSTLNLSKVDMIDFTRGWAYEAQGCFFS